MVLQQTRYYTPENNLYSSNNATNFPPSCTAATTPYEQNEGYLHGTMTHLFPTGSPKTDQIMRSTPPEELSPAISSSFPEVESNDQTTSHADDVLYYHHEDEDDDDEEKRVNGDVVEDKVKHVPCKHHKSAIPSISLLMSQSKNSREHKYVWGTSSHDDENDDDSYSDGDDEELLKIEVRKFSLTKQRRNHSVCIYDEQFWANCFSLLCVCARFLATFFTAKVFIVAQHYLIKWIK
jgi:hypothetical protein